MLQSPLLRIPCNWLCRFHVVVQSPSPRSHRQSERIGEGREGISCNEADDRQASAEDVEISTLCQPQRLADEAKSRTVPLGQGISAFGGLLIYFLSFFGIYILA